MLSVWKETTNALLRSVVGGRKKTSLPHRFEAPAGFQTTDFSREKCTVFENLIKPPKKKREKIYIPSTTHTRRICRNGRAIKIFFYLYISTSRGTFTRLLAQNKVCRRERFGIPFLSESELKRRCIQHLEFPGDPSPQYYLGLRALKGRIRNGIVCVCHEYGRIQNFSW
jgi:hypothetical protein